jgi:hypothetical protein
MKKKHISYITKIITSPLDILSKIQTRNNIKELGPGILAAVLIPAPV